MNHLFCVVLNDQYRLQSGKENCRCFEVLQRNYLKVLIIFLYCNMV